MATIVTRTDPTYLIVGLVVDRRTRAGLGGVQVEAWDLDTRYHDMLGQVASDEQGEFRVGFEPDYFGDFAPDRSPDLFFRVFIDGALVLSTQNTPRMNVARGRTQVTLEVDRPELPAAKADRINVEQSIKAIDWWRASDFRGVFREGGGKLATLGGVLGTNASRKLSSWDFEPVRGSGAQEKAVVQQSVTAATSALATQQVQVAEVREVDKSTRSTLKSLADTPLVLQRGDRVTLYQENGVVKYYTRVPAQSTSSIDQQAVARIDADVQLLKTQAQDVEGLKAAVGELKSADSAVERKLSDETGGLRERIGEVESLRRELVQLRQAQVERETEFTRLQRDLVALRTAQDGLSARLPAQRLEALELQLGLVHRPRAAQPAKAQAPKKTAAKVPSKSKATLSAKAPSKAPAKAPARGKS